MRNRIQKYRINKNNIATTTTYVSTRRYWDNMDKTPCQFSPSHFPDKIKSAFQIKRLMDAKMKVIFRSILAIPEKRAIAVRIPIKKRLMRIIIAP